MAEIRGSLHTVHFFDASLKPVKQPLVRHHRVENPEWLQISVKRLKFLPVLVCHWATIDVHLLFCICSKYCDGVNPNCLLKSLEKLEGTL